MTGDEMERAIEFLLRSQANLETQIAETNKIVQLHAETQTQFIQIVTRHIEAQGEINASLRASIKQAAAQIKQADAQIKQAEAQIKQADVKIKQADARINQTDVKIKQADAKINRTDTRLDRLEALVERYIEGRNGQG